MARVGYEPLGSMKAWGARGAGCELLEQPRPAAKPGTCVVRVSAVGMNPTDWKHIGSNMHYYTITKATAENPVILGSEGSGVVEAVGAPGASGAAEAAPGFEVGQKVWFMARKACAELVEVKQESMAIAPNQMSMEEAGSAPLALLTAYQSMKDAGYSEPGCGKGQRILIHAGAGGVGHFALQLAKIYDFDEIVTTCSSANADFVKSLGATSMVDYKTEEDFVTKYANAKFDVVLDPVGGEPVGCCCAGSNALAQYAPRSRKVTKVNGTVIGIITGSSFEGPCGAVPAICCSCLPGLCMYKCSHACGLGPNYVGPFFLRVPEAGADLTKLTDWVNRQQLKTEIAEVFSFEDAPKALSALEEGGGHNTKKSKSKAFRGKIVVQVS